MKIRLDALLLQSGLVRTRNKAQALIMTGQVLVDGKKITKSGQMVDADLPIRILSQPSAYVSRGGEKLEGACKEFGFAIEGKTALDVGISTGGFSDFLLQNGAEKVIGVDVGYGQVDGALRNNPKLVVKERLNARNLRVDDVGEAIDLVVMDVSFISVLKVLPAVKAIAGKDADFVVLIKPQFEAGKEQVGKGGVIRDPAVHEAVLGRLKIDLGAMGFRIVAECPSPILGAKGNKEFFFWLKPE